MSNLERVIYRSRATLLPDAEVIGGAIDDIAEAARANNARDAITGVLVYSDGVFMQVLEGRPPALDATLARIGKDRRHKDLHVLRRETVSGRMFPDTPLAFVSSAMVREATMGSGRGISMDIGRLPTEIFAPLLRTLLTTPSVPNVTGMLRRA
ncbi:MAG: BLUF domain-containing protein [Rhodobiaceae bacterium]|nr:BLUF domain-containing protein [Rhodobiaceae bacterium]MCC0016928.1 BLUF domain-containing protein [Rhodobiaceae bacterium]MCC0042069.1 BLUF domain-containing protein [Rhodobiaceae bacterium]MCC0054168.1 BLUF domain-containing protein [Rhodobiaceae bacterium]